MVESALEFARIARKNDFHNFKFLDENPANPKVMIECYRLLGGPTRTGRNANWNYPIHLGRNRGQATERMRASRAPLELALCCATDWEDTIRVSLTEDFTSRN